MVVMVVMVEESAHWLSPKHQFGKGQKLLVDTDFNYKYKYEYAPVFPYLYPPLSTARWTVYTEMHTIKCIQWFAQVDGICTMESVQLNLIDGIQTALMAVTVLTAVVATTVTIVIMATIVTTATTATNGYN